MATFDATPIEAAYRLNLFSAPLSKDQLLIYRKPVITASRYLAIVGDATDGISQAALSDALGIGLNAVGCFTRLLARLDLIVAYRQQSSVGCSYIIHPKKQ